jgi:surface antigen
LAQGALQELLETAGSGSAAVVKGEDGGAWTLRATFTFRTASHTPCRRYEISGGAARRFAGYACRSEEGVWLVCAHADLNTNAPSSRPKDGGFAPAARASEVALDAAIRAAMDGDVYQLSEEQQLLASRWASVRK